MPVSQLRMAQLAGPADYLTRRPSLRSKPKSSALSTAYKRSMPSTQQFERRSFEATNIEISVTSPCIELPGSRVGGGTTHSVFPVVSPSISPPADRYALDRLGRSLSLTTLGTSASSSGSDPLDSPPYDLDNLPHVNVSIRSSVSSTNTRPSMRHFPSLVTLRTHRRSQTSSDEEYAYVPRAEYEPRPSHDKPQGEKEGGDTVGKRLKDGVGQLLGTKGPGFKRSRLLKKLKQRAGVKLSRLFSSDSEDASSAGRMDRPTRQEAPNHGSEGGHGEADWSNSGSESGSGSSNGHEDHIEIGNYRHLARADTGVRPRRRRPSMSIDLSSVSTFQHELASMPGPKRLPHPSAFRTRSGYYRYNALPTIIGSPSLPMSPPEEYRTPSSGSPILSMTDTAEPQAGLMSLVEQCHTSQTGPTSSSRRNAIDLDRTESNGWGIDPLEPDNMPPKPSMKPIDLPSIPGMSEVTSIFSPSIYRAPKILAMRDTPPISPLDIASPVNSGMNPFDFTYSPPTSRAMRPMSSFEMLEHRTSSMSNHSRSSVGGSHAHSRTKIDGHPSTASFGSMISDLHGEAEAEPDSPAMPLSSETRTALLPRSSFDVGIALGSPPPHPAGIAPRPSLPNVHFASPPTPTRAVFSPPLTSPRLLGSPRFAQSSFPPISTPPSLIANPKSLGDPYPNGLSDSASHNLAGVECACGCEAHSEPHVKRRASTKRKPVPKVTENRDAVILDVDIDMAPETPAEIGEAVEGMIAPSMTVVLPMKGEDLAMDICEP